MNRNESKKSGCLVGAIAGLATAIGLIVIFVLLFFFGGFPDVYRKPAKYEEALNAHFVHTGFLVFPEEIPASGLEADPEFYYFFQDTWNWPTVEVFLRCTYSDADFAAELERLEGAKKVTEYGEKQLMRDEEGRFSFPAYIAILDQSNRAEYALITGDREITYVYYCFRKPGSFRAVPDDCLPEPFQAGNGGIAAGFSVYMFQDPQNPNTYPAFYSR